MNDPRPSYSEGRGFTSYRGHNMQCHACGSAAVSTGLGHHVSCFDCGFHGEHLHAPSADSAVEKPAPAPKKGKK